MADNNIIQFQANVPEEMAFTYASGKLSTNGSYYRGTTDGRKVFLKAEVENQLVAMGVQPGERVQITMIERRQGTRRFVSWEVKRVDPPGDPGAPVQHQPVPIQATPVTNVQRAATSVQRETTETPNLRPANGAPPARETAPPATTAQPKPNGSATENFNTEPKIHHTQLSQALSGALVATVDAFLQTSEYAKSKGLQVEWHLDFTGELLQRLATSAFIAIMDGKAQALNLRARNEQIRETRVANGGASWPH